MPRSRTSRGSGAGGLQESFDELRCGRLISGLIRELDGSAPPMSKGALWEQAGSRANDYRP